MRKVVIICLVLGTLLISPGAETFRFHQVAGDRYRMVSQVYEDVYINGIYSHSAEILNRISLEVAETGEGDALLEAEFLTSERASGSGGTYDWGREYLSRFRRDTRGRYTIGEEFFMPVLRDIPVFPEGEIHPGESWTHPAWEVHDLRDNLGVSDPYSFSMNVEYTYRGREEVGGLSLGVIEIRYTIFHRADPPYGASAHYPVRISGLSDQVLYWNFEEGRPELSRENFDIFFDLYSGDSVEYRGQAEGRLVEAVLMDRQELADNLRRDLEDRGLEDTEVVINERGVTLTLRNIHFPPDSARLWASEKEKLNEICEILAGIPDRDIEIAGHTALAGTPEGRLRLSVDRARAVGEYLLERGCRRAEEMIIQGYGAERPVADNRAPAGMALNRRVEITILEN